MKKQENGFSGIELLFAIVVVVVLGVVGWLVLTKQIKPKTPTQTATTAASKQTKKPSEPLTIQEWNIKVSSPDVPDEATYRLVTDNKYLKPSIFLSTQMLDDSEMCQQYYTDPMYPTYQYIERYSPEDKVPLDEGLRKMTIQQAAASMPNEFKVIDGYGYWFRHGNGMPCNDGGEAVFRAFQKTFPSLTSTK